ncbi:hypothetical protein BU25DRAFT_444595 [Macroventuria anomochaeta]|uniref:Uncharacterized protein n=1 Tax=Macroventuria anomochaeta TaxID=301207 RepID=A0ACB6SK84_9PLEO|nr:uncharacterized protein BU25DRAFT_444595 [Macroventuria anomochaeta]KAF2634004.1 hypothetical protein BU25DRAFT_444595 [Macroventuria anomochaeta]
MAPRSGTADILSSPSFSDTEAASQQLLAEASSPVRRQYAAVIGANLLNAARMLPKPPAPALTQAGRAGKLLKPGKLRPGSLKRVSLPEERPRKVRGTGVYDLNPSPQKRSSLPAQVVASEDEAHAQNSVSAGDIVDVVPETSQVRSEDDVPAEVPESDDVPAANEEPVEDDHVEIVPVSLVPPVHEEASSAIHKWRGRPPKRKSGGSTVSARLSDAGTVEVQEEDEPSAISTKAKRKVRYEDVPNTATSVEPSDKAPVAKRRRRLNGPRFVSPDAAEFDEVLIAPKSTTQQDARPRGDPQPEVRVFIRPTGLRTAQAELEEAKDNSATAIPATASGQRRKVSAQPVRATTRKIQAINHVLAQVDDADGENVAEAPQPSAHATGDGGKCKDDREDKPRNAGTRSNEDHGQDHGQDNGQDNDDGPDGEHNDEQNDEQDEGAREHDEQNEEANNECANLAGSQTTNDQFNRLHALDKVFQFADSEERSGVCSTKLGRNIHRRCDRSRVTLSQSGEDCSLDDITRCKDDLTDLLTVIGSWVQQERRVVFKRDAFAYLFRALTLVLEAMHDKLQEKQGEITESLEAMQIVYPFICEVLKFKDTMDAWKVTVPQQTQGDRLIKSVEGGLITPLRAVEKAFRVKFGHLKKVQQTRQALLDLQRQREEQEQALIQREDAVRAGRERRKRWQDIHIARMQCEPDPARRRRLRFVEPVELVETDADGRQFERVPFFIKRSMPPPQSTPASSGKEWTKEQETMLLDALQSSDALERIFKKYCGPNGALRDFSVSDFAAKMTWVRSGWAQLSQQHGWEVPEWVQKIPLLP